MTVTYSPAVTDTDFAQEVEQHEGVTMVDFESSPILVETHRGPDNLMLPACSSPVFLRA